MLADGDIGILSLFWYMKTYILEPLIKLIRKDGCILEPYILKQNSPLIKLIR